MLRRISRDEPRRCNRSTQSHGLWGTWMRGVLRRTFGRRGAERPFGHSRSQPWQHRSRRVREGDRIAVPGRALRARADSEEARWGVIFQLHRLPVRIKCEDKRRTYQRFLDEQPASSLSLRHLLTVTRPAFRSEPGGSRQWPVTVTAIQDSPSQNIAAVVSFQNAAGQPGSPHAATT